MTKFKLGKRQQRRLIQALLVLALILLGGVYSSPELRDTLSENQPGLYEVVEVSDGDTIVVNLDDNEERVRLIGVDTPETNHPSKPVQCFGRAATQFTTHLIDGHLVRLEADPTNSNRDRYNRLLRYVYLDDGTLVNKSIIEEGYGFAYTSFPFEKKDEFILAQSKAQAESVGLWESCEINDLGDGRVETSAEQ